MKATWYAKKYNVMPRQIRLIGAERMDAMTELGREIITIIIRMETPKRRHWDRKPVKSESRCQVERMMEHSARVRA
jgi:hypothetical protein